MLAVLFSHFKLNRFPFNLLNLSLVKTILCAATAGELICRRFCSDNPPPSSALLCPNKWLDYISQICFLTRLPTDLLHAVCGGSDPAGGGRRLHRQPVPIILDYLSWSFNSLLIWIEENNVAPHLFFKKEGPEPGCPALQYCLMTSLKL